MRVEFGESFSIGGKFGRTGVSALELVWIGPATVDIGSPVEERGRSTSERRFRASITSGFWIGRYPITRHHWCMGNGDVNGGDEGGWNLPKGGVSWFDAIGLCERLNCNYGHLLPNGYSFMLPTEVQWEHACRAGSHTTFWWGDDINEALHCAWYAENSGGRPRPVGLKRLNRFGLADMSGNVWEWCLDAFGPYPDGVCDDPCNIPSNSEDAKTISFVQRGGSFMSSDKYDLRCSTRSYCRANGKAGWFGFRLCLAKTLPLDRCWWRR